MTTKTQRRKARHAVRAEAFRKANTLQDEIRAASEREAREAHQARMQKEIDDKVQAIIAMRDKEREEAAAAAAQAATLPATVADVVDATG